MGLRDYWCVIPACFLSVCSALEESFGFCFCSLFHTMMVPCMDKDTRTDLATCASL